jgi:iron complex outermembrane receptor protein
MISKLSRQTPIAHFVAAVLASAAGLSAATPAFAQEGGGLEEVLVTATRRGETDIQTTPVAVTALSDKDLGRIVGQDVGGIAASIPNFSAARIAAFNAASFAIRGVGQTDIIVYLDSPVAVNIDDFVTPSVQTQLLDTFDIERVEVLRGPQGTLFGKNTTGGLVNVVTKKPTIGESSAQLQGLYGSFNRYQVQGALNLPVGDTFGLRFVGSYNKSDGYYENGATYGPMVSFTPKWAGLTGRGDGDDVGGDDVINGRVKALWQPSEDMSLLLQYEILRDRSDAVPSFNDTPSEPGCVAFVSCQFVWNSIGATSPTGDPIDNMATTSRNDGFMATGRGQEIDVDGFYANFGWDLGAVRVDAVAGYREQDSRLPNTYTGAVPIATDGEQLSLFDASRDDDRETTQFEARLSSSSDSALSWVLGGFYQKNDDVFCVAQMLGINEIFGVGGANNTPSVLCNKQDAESYAAFGDVTWQLTDKWTLGAGVRWTDEKKEWTGRPQASVEAITGGLTWQDLGEPLDLADFDRADWPGNAGVRSDDHSWSEVTYTGRVGYQFNEDVNTYFRYDRGFKSGGYNDQTGTATVILDAFLQPYEPEFADSFELGLKTSTLEDRLRFNAALFYVKYTDAQRALVTRVCVPNPDVVNTCSGAGQQGTQFQETRFFNAADVTVKGVELEATALVVDGLTVKANISYNDGKYDKFEADTNGDGANDVFLSGLPLTRTPEWKGGLQGLYAQPLSVGGQIDYYMSVSYEDSNVFYYSDVDPAFNAVLDERTLLDASITYTADDSRWFVRAYGNNLTDERYRVASQVVANLWTHSQFGAPRNYGIQMGLNFNW